MLTFVKPMAEKKITQETRQTVLKWKYSPARWQNELPNSYYATISSIHLAQNFLHFPL